MSKSRVKSYKRLKTVSKEEQKQEIERMWKLQESRIDVEENSTWYVISAEWFNQWKQWTGFNTPAPETFVDESTKESLMTSESAETGEVQEPGRIDSYDILEADEIMLFGEYNLKDNLNEGEDYVIVSPEIWEYLSSIYDGNAIARTAIRNIDSKEDNEEAKCIIEVNLVKLYLFEVPRENKQDYYEVMLASRNWDMDHIK